MTPDIVASPRGLGGGMVIKAWQNFPPSAQQGQNAAGSTQGNTIKDDKANVFDVGAWLICSPHLNNVDNKY